MSEEKPHARMRAHSEEAHGRGASSLEHDEESVSFGASPGKAAETRFAQTWMVVAVLCLVAAAICLLRGMLNAAFVMAVLGVLAWFLNVRAGLRRSVKTEIVEDDVEDEES